MEGTFTYGSYSRVKGTFTCGTYSCVEGESHTAPVHVNYRVRELYVTHVYVHVSHIQLPYMVINMQDGGGHIYVWKGHSHVGVTHV